MRVFVSEYVSGGAWPEETLDGSLAVEGRAMLLSLLDDLLRVPDMNVVTTWDQRLGAFPLEGVERLCVVRVSSPEDEARQFKRLCEESDAAIVIAPEFHGILAARVQTASTRTRLIGCDFEATSLCSDKLRLAKFLNEAGIPTIPTDFFELPNPREKWTPANSIFPCVIKPRDGAGSLLTFRVDDSEKLNLVSQQLRSDGAEFNFIRQPFVEGIAASCAVIIAPEQGCDPGSPLIDVLPPCEQILTDDGAFSYLGADYPGRLKPTDRSQVEKIVRQCCSVIPGLSGYVGFDLLLPHLADLDPIIVDINPRLTTGYLLWRRICRSNLATRKLEVPENGNCQLRIPLVWDQEAWNFRVDSISE